MFTTIIRIGVKHLFFIIRYIGLVFGTLSKRWEVHDLPSFLIRARRKPRKELEL